MWCQQNEGWTPLTVALPFRRPTTEPSTNRATFPRVKRLALVALVLVAACSGDQSADPQGDWLHVLSRKKAAVAPDATPQAKQVYADSLAAFLAKHPRHSRARDVYHRVQLEFARELAAHGRYADAIGFYRAVLDDDPDNQTARKGVQDAAERMAV